MGKDELMLWAQGITTSCAPIDGKSVYLTDGKDRVKVVYGTMNTHGHPLIRIVSSTTCGRYDKPSKLVGWYGLRRFSDLLQRPDIIVEVV